MRISILLFAGLVLFAQSPPPTGGARVQLNVEHQPSFGPADAPVTIVEFGDFECPSCRAEAPLLSIFSSKDEPELKKEGR